MRWNDKVINTKIHTNEVHFYSGIQAAGRVETGGINSATLMKLI